VDDELEQIQPAIEPGESIVWSGRPDPSVIFTAADGLLLPYGVFFTGFYIFWLTGVLNTKAPALFVLFGSAFLLIGLYYLVGRFIVKWWLKRRTAYAITNRRAIVIVGRRNIKDSSLTGGSRVSKLSRNGQHITVTFIGSEGPRQYGIFNRNQLYPNTGLDPFDFGHRLPVAFYDVADVDGLRTALLRVSAPTPPSTQSSPN
jgi:hypothetical protein